MNPPFSKNGFLKHNVIISYLVICDFVLGRNSRKKKEKEKMGKNISKGSYKSENHNLELYIEEQL